MNLLIKSQKPLAPENTAKVEGSRKNIEKKCFNLNQLCFM